MAVGFIHTDWVEKCEQKWMAFINYCKFLLTPKLLWHYKQRQLCCQFLLCIHGGILNNNILTKFLHYLFHYFVCSNLQTTEVNTGATLQDDWWWGWFWRLPLGSGDCQEVCCANSVVGWCHHAPLLLSHHLFCDVLAPFLVIFYSPPVMHFVKLLLAESTL